MESWKNILLGKLEFYKKNNNKFGEQIVSSELDDIKYSNEKDFDIFFYKPYAKPGKANFFKKSILYIIIYQGTVFIIRKKY